MQDIQDRPKCGMIGIDFCKSTQHVAQHLLLVFYVKFPKQWYTEGLWRLGKDIHECAGSSPAPVARQLLCTGCGLGEGQVALVHAKRSLAPLSTEKQICFGTISFRSSSGPPLAQMPPRCLPDASQMPLRCLQMPPDASPKKLFGVSRWGN